MERAAHMENKSKEYTEFWWENLKESDYWEYLSVDRSIILKLILKKGVGGRVLDSVESG
jgi:hypothetical protein